MKILRFNLAMMLATMVLPGFGTLAAQDGVPLSPAYVNPDYELELGGLRFDPLVESPSIPPEWRAQPSAEADLHLIQFYGPTRDIWLKDLETARLKVVQYIHPFTYVVWGRAQDLALAGDGVTVRWRGDFEPAFRVLPQWRVLSGSELDIWILIYRGASFNSVRSALEALDARQIEVANISEQWAVIGCRLAGNRFSDAARIAGVYSIQPETYDGGTRGEMSNQIIAGNVNQVGFAVPGYAGWLAGLGLSGQGIIVGHVDSGDNEAHPDLVTQYLVCSGDTCGGAASNNHGTHTAAILAGSAASGSQSLGFLQGLGVAPESKLIEQVYFTYNQPDGLRHLIQQSFENGADLSSNSWGPSSLALGYNLHTLQVDLGVRDADPMIPGNQGFSYIVAVANGNGGTSSQGTPDEGKNLFSVGSTVMQNGATGGQYLNFNDISANSAHGPALDGRFLPHIVAPGCYVDSASGPASYGRRCGTSMATPHVAGAVALFIEYWRNANLGSGVDPSPALIKAAFLPAAVDLFGNKDADGGSLGHRVDSKQGWGRLNLREVIAPSTNVLYFDNPQVLEGTGDSWSHNIEVADPSKPVKLMLVWTDAAGHGLGGATPAWVNDLDLAVTYQGQLFHGNQFAANGWSVAGAGTDIRNNTEGVMLGPTASGLLQIEVVAANLAGDGIPGVGDGTDQDFALVCYNCAEEKTFEIQVDESDQSSCSAQKVQFEVDISPLNKFQDPVTLSVANLPMGAVAMFSANPVVPPATVDLSITTVAGTDGTFQVKVVGTSVSQIKNADFNMRVFDQVPQAVSLTQPANLTLNSGLRPNFIWQTTGQAERYRIEISKTAIFDEPILIEEIAADNFQPEFALEPFTFFYWRVIAANSCGDGPASPVSRFRTRALPPVLLVDDDNNDPDVRGAYAEILDDLDISYDVWDTADSLNEPLAPDLTYYQMVIWFSGAAGNFFDPKGGPSDLSELALATYLDGGACLFISAQEYLFDRGGPTHREPTAFMADYLGLLNGMSNVGQSTVTGSGGLFGGLGTLELTYPFPDLSDTLTPNAGMDLWFAGDMGDAAIAKTTPDYRTAYWGFPFEALSFSDRQAVMQVMMTWCPLDQTYGCNNSAALLAETENWPQVVSVRDLIWCANQIE